MAATTRPEGSALDGSSARAEGSAMIAHVAKVDEARGRVVLRICHRVRDDAVMAAARVAAAYEAQLETVYVEDEDVHTCAEFSFAVELTPSGTRRRSLGGPAVAQSYSALRERSRRAVSKAAAAFDITVAERAMRNDPIRSVAIACAENGPWNIIALAEPASATEFDGVRRLFTAVKDNTGLVIVGRHQARSRRGPIVAVVDRAEDLMGTLRAAERIAAASGEAVIVMLVAAPPLATGDLEGEVRLAIATETELGRRVELTVPSQTFGEPSAIVAAVLKPQPSFVIARFGGPLSATKDAFSTVMAHLPCPVLFGRGIG
ncbi:MAG: hypothetical protein AAFQ11_01700 [Pseudomonadota bacterium]